MRENLTRVSSAAVRCSVPRTQCEHGPDLVRAAMEPAQHRLRLFGIGRFSRRTPRATTTVSAPTITASERVTARASPCRAPARAHRGGHPRPLATRGRVPIDDRELRTRLSQELDTPRRPTPARVEPHRATAAVRAVHVPSSSDSRAASVSGLSIIRSLDHRSRARPPCALEYPTATRTPASASTAQNCS